MEDQHLLSDQRGRTRTRVVALGLAAVACGLVAAVAVTGSKAVSLMQYQIVNIPRRWLPPPLPPSASFAIRVDEICAAPMAYNTLARIRSCCIDDASKFNLGPSLPCNERTDSKRDEVMCTRGHHRGDGPDV
jgi:hypothetical protein